MHVYVFTRFSVFSPGATMWRMSTNAESEERYKQQLYAPRRMQEKFELFARNTLPSMQAQTKGDMWTWFIYVGAPMPDRWKRKLEHLCAHDARIQLIYVSNTAQFDQHTDYITAQATKPFATMRLDDDDGLHKTYVERLQAFAGAPTGTIIAPRRGYHVSLTGPRKRRRLAVMDEKNVGTYPESPGLACLNENIHRKGAHHRTPEHYTVRFIEDKGMFYRAIQEHNDSQLAHASNTFKIIAVVVVAVLLVYLLWVATGKLFRTTHDGGASPSSVPVPVPTHAHVRT